VEEFGKEIQFAKTVTHLARRRWRLKDAAADSCFARPSPGGSRGRVRTARGFGPVPARTRGPNIFVFLLGLECSGIVGASCRCGQSPHRNLALRPPSMERSGEKVVQVSEGA
jgi:hypothetical protein